MLLTLINKKTEATNVITWTFQSATPLSPIAGQYFHYLLPHDDADERGVERWFTNSAAPSEDHIKITARIDLEHGSSFKRALMALKRGDTIEADGPEGSFVVTDFSRNYVFVAGGIGITPFRSILAEARVTNQPIKATLIYGNRTNDVAFKEELDETVRHLTGLKIDYRIGPAGLSAEDIKSVVNQTEDALVYISGPKPMVLGLSDELQALGVASESIKKDDFPGYEAM